jgi:hypothetical protein
MHTGIHVDIHALERIDVRTQNSTGSVQIGYRKT